MRSSAITRCVNRSPCYFRIMPDEPDSSLFNRGRVGERSDAALIRRAIKHKWPVSDEIKQLVTNQMALIVGRSEDERNQIAASKVLVAADSVNARREATEVEAERPAAGTMVSILVNQVLANDRGRNLLAELTEALEPGGPSETGQRRTVDDSPPPGPSQPGLNGSSNGQH